MNPKFLTGAGLLAAGVAFVATAPLTCAEPVTAPGQTVEASNVDVNTPAAGARHDRYGR